MTRTLGTAALAAALLLGGCVESSMVARTRFELEQGLPQASFERAHAFHLNRLSTAMLKPVTLWALGEEGEDLDLLRAIRRVDVAVYEVLSFPDSIRGDELSAMDRRLGKAGWTRMLRSRESDEVTWIYSRESRSGGIRDLFVISVDGVEMVMVRVGGKLDRVLADLIADDPGGFGASLGG